MKTFLTTKEASDITLGIVPELTLASKFKMVLKGARNITAFSNLVYVIGKMKEMNAHYEKYPQSPDKFVPFKQKVVETIEDAKRRFPSSPL